MDQYKRGREDEGYGAAAAPYDPKKPRPAPVGYTSGGIPMAPPPGFQAMYGHATGPMPVPIGATYAAPHLQAAPQRTQQKGNEATQEARSLYIGNLSPKVQESLLHDIFSCFGIVEGCKIIKDKLTNESQGYGFVDYFDHATAQMAMNAFSGKLLYGNELKVNWAQAGGQKEDTTSHHHIFVGDLSGEIDDKALHDAFSAFGSISDARIMTDPVSARSRGYGFVSFRKKDDAQRALSEMNGEWLGNRAIRCNWANQKGTLVPPPSDSGLSAFTLDFHSVVAQTPQSNTTVYVGNITPETSEQMVRAVFAEFGAIDEIKMQADKGFAFVRFPSHDTAAKAICGMHGKVIGSRAVKCSWGRPLTTNSGPGMVPLGMNNMGPPLIPGMPPAMAPGMGPMPGMMPRY